jgi:GTP-binding protein
VDINVVKEKVQTNFRMSNKEIKPPLTPAVKMSLEQALDFIEEDELLEITPTQLRIRNKVLTKLNRVREARKLYHQEVANG